MDPTAIAGSGIRNVSLCFRTHEDLRPNRRHPHAHSPTEYERPAEKQRTSSTASAADASSWSRSPERRAPPATAVPFVIASRLLCSFVRTSSTALSIIACGGGRDGGGGVKGQSETHEADGDGVACHLVRPSESIPRLVSVWWRGVLAYS